MMRPGTAFNLRRTANSWLFLIALFMYGHSFAQLTYTDSMRVAIFNHASPDTARMRALNRLAIYFSNNNLDSAERYAKLMLKLGERRNNSRLRMRALCMLGEVEGKRNNFAGQIELFTQALNMAEKLNDSLATAAIYNRFANMYINTNDMANAKELVQKNVDFLRSQGKEGGHPRWCYIYYSMGRIACQEKNYSKALYHMDASLKLADRFGVRNNWYFSGIYKDLGFVYEGLKNYTKAIQYFKKAIALEKQMNNLSELSVCEQGLAAVLLKSNDGDSALVQIQHSEKVANRANNKNALLSAYDHYIDLYGQQKDYKKKSEYLALKMRLKDSLDQLVFSRALADSKIKFDTEKKEKENAILQQKNSVLQLRVTTARNQVIMLLVLALGVFAALLFWNRYSKLATAKKNIELEHKLFRSQMNPHFIFNSLSSMQSFVLAQEPLKAAKYISNFSKVIRTIFENSRREFVPLDEEIEALKTYLELEKTRSGQGFEFHVETGPVSGAQLLVPPTLIQPFVENAIKHGLSAASEKTPGKITIAFFYKGHNLFCNVDDNGIGINRAMALRNNDATHHSAGIDITCKRLKLLCKQFGFTYLFSVIDKKDLDVAQTGTVVSFLLPYMSEPVAAGINEPLNI